MAKDRFSRPRWHGLSRLIAYEDKREIWADYGYDPHAGQVVAHRSAARFKVLSCGRRWGKTTGFAVGEVLPVLLLGGWVWGCGPDHETSSVLFDAAIEAIDRSPNLMAALAEDPNMAKGNQVMRFRSGGLFAAKSMNDDRRLRGRGLDFIVCDEGAMVPTGKPWSQGLRPALADRMGGAIFTSTPKGGGDHWYKKIFDYGDKRLLSTDQRDPRPDWMSFHFPSSSNPYLPKSEIRDAKRDSTEEDFLQEWLAVFLDEAGGVFKAYLDVALADLAEDDDGRLYDPDADPDAGGYVGGIDIAVTKDYTVAWIARWDIARAALVPVWIERFSRVAFDAVEELVRRLTRRFKGVKIYLDATNERGFAAGLEKEHPNVKPFVFTSASKPWAINGMKLAIEEGAFWLPTGGTVAGSYALREFGQFQYQKTAAGNVRMAAPGESHDDVVMAAALCYAMHVTVGANGGGASIPATQEAAKPASPLEAGRPNGPTVVARGTRQRTTFGHR